ncbi:tail fiber/spike domain-containing protein [Obesumbacterium proteus]|uniref:tail fiber/spike domain-containing protein n=1 Tax=Obesumbacterium proteus TaxID=82983 RepID=UPI001F31BB73|nr:hypothetical protein [Obesumbacterium proteus]MCE9886236.1 hypothetical protein [Obesumbacterium proteus]
MATTPTALPVPSESPRDLKFNAGKIDEFVTSLTLKYIDRFGLEHYTIEGLRQLAQQAIAAFGWIPLDSFQDGATLTLPNQVLRWKLPDGDGEYYRWDGALPKTVPAGSTPESTGGIGAGAWVGIGDAALRSALAAENGGSLIGLKRRNLTGSLTTDLDSYYQASPINAITDYGLVPDFDPTTGVANGTNNTAKLQALMDALVDTGGNKTVIIPAGNYYFNFDGTPNTGGVGVMWGRVGAGLKNVTFLCYGATFYQGSIGRFNGVFSAQGGVNIIGLNVIGYGGGELATARERDACFTVNYNSIGVKFKDCYMDNSLGDCIYIGGSLVSGGENNYTSRDVEICGCVLKERYGNGVRSYNKGSRSRVAVAVIDAVGVKIYDSVIYGEIDLEPNIDGQRLQNINIYDITFKSGNVQPNPSNPYQVEQVYVGSQTIRGGISIQSRSGAITTTNININKITLEYGRISVFISPDAVCIDNVRMRRGIFLIGNSAGTNYSPGFKISNCYVELNLNGQDDDFNEDGVPDVIPSVMFWIKGNIAYSNFSSNMCGTPSSGLSYMFYTSDVGVATDIGRNTYINNYMTGGGSIFNFAININSVSLSNLSMSSLIQSIPSTTTQSFRSLITEALVIPLTANGGISWPTYQGTKWKLVPNAARTFSGITNGPQVGMEVQIRSDGSFPVTLTSSNNFYLKDGANTILDNSRKIITMQLIEPSIWVEINRNF